MTLYGQSKRVSLTNQTSVIIPNLYVTLDHKTSHKGNPFCYPWISVANSSSHLVLILCVSAEEIFPDDKNNNLSIEDISQLLTCVVFLVI